MELELKDIKMDKLMLEAIKRIDLMEKDNTIGQMATIIEVTFLMD